MTTPGINPSGPAPQPAPAQESTPEPTPEPGTVGRPAPAQGTDRFAVAALVLGLAGASVLAIIFGFVGLSRVKKSGRKGRGMTIAGIVLGFVWLVIALALVGLAVARHQDNLDRIAAEPDTVGQCFDIADGASLEKAAIVPCDGPHRWEVFAITTFPAGDFPGTATLSAQADTFCASAISAYVTDGTDLQTVGITFSTPNETAWALGSRNALCLAGNYDGTPATGSYTD
ncbi:DUF4190 domain-containing protein [Xylanimonas allomyrinae]|uniref:DUF4190 domain-containing protein n=1 Tax=Xylanimonas allomyrinae TaxID=2509459 RepID=A0A4P6EVC3_9MICO|nr:DUF4190 domain-containing protein [Xylanimonas allomyrinae]QAY61988.1 DUF4190 domain-containing protein [Xylanimonas allomyrinae]